MKCVSMLVVILAVCLSPLASPAQQPPPSSVTTTTIPPPLIKELSLKGQVTREITKNNQGKETTVYALVTPQGMRYEIPPPRAGVRDDEINADMEVLVKAELSKDGKRILKIRETLSLKKIPIVEANP